MGTVSNGAIIGMVFSFSVSIGLPITLCVIAKKKTNAKISSMLLGAATFLVFALILEQILHTVVLGFAKDTLMNNIWLYALYGGLAAGLFEETGRFFTMKVLMKKNLDWDNAVMYGIGHGGIEAIIIVGLTQLSNIVTSIMINTGTLEASISMLDESTKAATMTQVAQLWELPSHIFYMAGVERISAVFLQIALSCIVYQAVKNKKIIYYLLAIAIHFLLDAVTIVLNQYISTILLEAILIVAVTVIVIVVFRRKSSHDNGIA